MNYMADRRKYQRCHNIVGRVMISNDEKNWTNIELCDISANGMCFTTPKGFDNNSKLSVNLYIYNMLAEFTMRLEANIIRFEKKSSKYVYAIKFSNINKYQLIQLDELVKSRICVAKEQKPHYHEENFQTIRYIPRMGRRKIKLY